MDWLKDKETKFAWGGPCTLTNFPVFCVDALRILSPRFEPIYQKMHQIVRELLTDIWNEEVIKDKTFSAKLKLGDITPVFKALQKTLKKNCRPISALIVVSKIMDKQ